MKTNTNPNYILTIAEACHEANRVYCKSIGDCSQPFWDDAPEWQKASAIQGVTYKLDNMDATPEDIHKHWMEGKEADGWVYGFEKNPDKKTHPCLVTYSELPPKQRAKDDIFSAVVVVFAKTYGLSCFEEEGTATQ